MKTKQSVEAQARSILQKVHNDACKKNHLPELGYSEKAYDLVMELIAQAKQEALSTFKAQVRKEIEELKKSAAISEIHWDDDQKTQRIIDRQKMYAHNQAITDCLSIPSLEIDDGN